MARNTLEAVFGALGAGLRGYGQDRETRAERARLEQERQDRLQRQGLEDELTVAGLMERGWGTPEQVREQGAGRARTALQMALQGATAGRGGMPMPTQVQQVAAQQARPERPQVNVAGRQLSMLENALERAQRERAEGMEAAEAERTARRQEFAEQERIRGERTTREIRERASAGGRATGLSPNDRAYQSTLAFASRLIQDPMGMEEPRFPTPEEVQAFAQQAKTVEGAIYGGGSARSGGNETGTGGTVTRKLDGETVAEYLARTAAPAPSPAAGQPSAPTATPANSAINSPRVASIKRQLDELSQGRNGSIAARERYASYAPQRERLEQELQELGLRYSEGYIISARQR